MKRFFLSLALCLSAGAGFAQSADTPAHAGFLKNVRGSVHLIDVSDQSRIARPGETVRQSDRIETSANAGASLVLRDGTVLVVGPSSRLNLREFQFDSTTHDGSIAVSLVQGTLRVISGLLGKAHPEAVRVDTQTATIGIRGTDFIVSADTDTAL